MNHRSIRLACLILSFCWAGSAKAEFVTNGSMTGPVGSEAIPPGWLAESDPSFYYSPSTIAPGGLTESGITVGQQIPASPDGGTFLVVSADSIFRHTEVYQEIAGLTPGASYSLSFYYANAGIEMRAPFPNLPGAIVASIAGQTFVTDPVGYDGPGQQIWRLASFSFVATDATERLTLETGDVFMGAVDGVSVVPEPASFVMAAAGFVACLAGRRRIRRSH